VKLDVLPSIDLSADAGLAALKSGLDATVSTDVSPGTGETPSDGVNIDLALTTPDIDGLLGSGEGGGESGHPLISLDSETDAFVNVPVFGEHGVLSGSTDLSAIVGGSQDVGSLLTAAMLDIGGDGGLGAIIGGDVYDGNVPLAGDLSSALGSTLDLLTTTSSLFDVPALDILSCDGLDS
jgi:hypothetical protein